MITGFGLFRLGRFADALATLRRDDVPKLAEAAGMLISPWNLLTMMTPLGFPGGMSGAPPGEWVIRTDSFDPVDLLVRAMGYHHLGHREEARVYLELARGMLGDTPQKGMNADQRALLREAESLIEGKPRQ